jgi:NAD(P)-dependent dehydrogenase (short-subunit alcohol dehydrogenase family)
VSEVVVVTGSSSGIGRAVAERFASDGAKVVVNSSRSVEEGELLPVRYRRPSTCKATSPTRRRRNA